MEGDIEGPYLFLQERLDGEEVNFVNTFGPNVDDGQFFTQIQIVIAPALDQAIIWAGDFKCILNGDLDRHPPQEQTYLFYKAWT